MINLQVIVLKECATKEEATQKLENIKARLQGADVKIIPSIWEKYAEIQNV